MHNNSVIRCLFNGEVTEFFNFAMSDADNRAAHSKSRKMIIKNHGHSRSSVFIFMTVAYLSARIFLILPRHLAALEEVAILGQWWAIWMKFSGSLNLIFCCGHTDLPAVAAELMMVTLKITNYLSREWTCAYYSFEFNDLKNFLLIANRGQFDILHWFL